MRITRAAGRASQRALRRRRVGLLAAMIAALLTVTGAPTPSLSPSTAAAQIAQAARSADDVVRRVVVISVDGLAPAALSRLGRSGAPSMYRMRAHGVSTLNARTLHESTSTLPNHTGMLTGRRVLASRGGHGVDFNSDNGLTVHAAAGEYVSSVFSVVHDRGGTTALYAGKPKFAVLDRSWEAEAGAPDGIGADQGRDKIDRYRFSEDADRLVGALVRQLRSDPATLSFLHLRLPDSAGHASGYLRRAYLRAVRRTDALVGRVLATIHRKPRLRRHTVVVLTADHGGQHGSRTHSDPRRRAHYRIPFFVWGASVAHGRNLYALNPDRRRPDRRRPAYRGRQPVRNADVANLVTDLLDLPAVPGSQLNRLRNLDVHAR